MTAESEDGHADPPTLPNGRPLTSFARIDARQVTHEEFTTAFDGRFDHVYSYVKRRVGTQLACERLVTEVLTTQLHLLVYCIDSKNVALNLKAASDRLIEAKVVPSATHGLETLTAAVERLAARGCQESFQVREDKLFSVAGHRLYDPNELIVDAIVRFEGDGDPSDASVLFALRSRDGAMRGTFIAGYGTAVDPETAAIVSSLRACPDAATRVLEHPNPGGVSVYT